MAEKFFFDKKILNQVLSVFQMHGEITKYLSFVFHTIISIKPPSTESEAAFSIGGNFVHNNYIWSSDSLLKSLIFLINYFNWENE